MKRINKLVLLGSLSLASTSSFAQFKQYRSKTDFADLKKTRNSAESIKDRLNKKESNESDNDFFGRAKAPTISKGPDKNKFVNLNTETAFGPEVITNFNFPDTPLTELTKHMQKLTGINLILDKEIKGKVSIMAATPITVGDAWKAYLSALNMNGYALVKSGAFYKVITHKDARTAATKIYTGDYIPNTENFIMKVISLKHVSADDVVRAFRSFTDSRVERILPIRETNTILIQATGANINRLLRLIQFIDVPGHEETLQIISVKYSSASEIAKLLDNILKNNTRSKFGSRTAAKTQGGENISKIIADPRTNSIIAMADAPGSEKLRQLIKRLDVVAPAAGSGQIHVYYLNHGNSETIAKTLSSLVSGDSRSKNTRTKTPFMSSAMSAGNNSLFNSEVRITSDKANNALVVTAQPTDYLTIKNVIKKLDITRDQVFVEGLIMETNVTKGNDWGVSIMGAYGSGAAKGGFTGGSSDLMNVLTNNITSLGGLFAGAKMGSEVTIQGPTGSDITVNTVNGLITAIATDNSSNVLATPQILALDNTEAVFEVGEKIPTLSRENSANGSTTTSTKYQDVSLKLKLTPQINKASRMIKMQIEQTIQDFSKTKLPSGLKSEGIPITNRLAKTSVVVRDRDTVAMGGLMRNKTIETENKVPLLGDIPLLGWLFKNTSSSESKVNLLFFLTPKILDTQEGTTADNVKDLLNRRNAHLKDILKDDDPFLTTAKGLYEKAEKQQKGPLYKKTENINEHDAIKKGQLINEEPNYQMIMNKVKEQNKGTI